MNFKLSDTVYLAKKDKGYTYINKSLCKEMPSDASDIMGYNSQAVRLARKIEEITDSTNILVIGEGITAKRVAYEINADYIQTTEDSLSGQYVFLDERKDGKVSIENKEAWAKAEVVVFVSNFITLDYSIRTILEEPICKGKEVIIATLCDTTTTHEVNGYKVISLTTLPEDDYSKYDIMKMGKPIVVTPYYRENKKKLPHVTTPPRMGDEKYGDRDFSECFWKMASDMLTKDTIIIGTEDYQYVPSEIAYNHKLKMMTTTKEHLMTSKEEGYPIKSGYEITSFYNKSKRVYLYNTEETANKDIVFITDSVNIPITCFEELDALSDILNWKSYVVITIPSRCSTYKPSDIELVVKDMGGDYKYNHASKEYLDLFDKLVEIKAPQTANFIQILGKEIGSEALMNPIIDRIVLLSCIPTGLSIGVLVKRFLEEVFSSEVDIYHYGVHMTTDGVDRNAIEYIKGMHGTGTTMYVGIDESSGKGFKIKTLKECGLKPLYFGVISDSKGYANFKSTYDDVLVPTTCLSAEIAGGITDCDTSNKMEHDFTKVYMNRDISDRTGCFIESIWKEIQRQMHDGVRVNLRLIASKYGVKRMSNLIPTISEATKTLMTEKAECLLIAKGMSGHPDIMFLERLAKEKRCPIFEEDILKDYMAVLIRRAKPSIAGVF